MQVDGQNPGTYYYVNDHLGTPQQLITATGLVVWQAAYLPYGEAQVRINLAENNLRFPGQYFDVESGLHYNWNRYYDAQTGRYISADPIGLEGGMNVYAYVLQNPVGFIDPSGLRVDGIFNSSTNSLFLVDSSGNGIVSGEFTSGGNPFGAPIPPGEYDILQHPDPDFFRLEPVDSPYGNDTHEATGRDKFRLHRPGRTIGCIAADNNSEWDIFKDLINRTDTDSVTVDSKSRLPWKPRTEALTRYGRIRVVK